VPLTSRMPWRRPLVGPRPARQAFGIDPARREYFSLRQSRYDALAQDVSDWAGAAVAGRKLRLLIIGCGVGTELRYLASKPHFDRLTLLGANYDDRHIWRRELYDEFIIGDLMGGYPEIRSNTCDIVVCEQVLEHLDRIEVAMATLGRVLKPGGRAIIGVPIFAPPLHLIRRHLIPRLDAAFGRRRARGHRQAFSLASFRRALERHSGLKLVKTRGFRVISGGLLRPLENYRWWWRLNRRLGEAVPGLCIEVQAVMEKPVG
jgi:SAM-dependent methyltransferase